MKTKKHDTEKEDSPIKSELESVADRTSPQGKQPSEMSGKIVVQAYQKYGEPTEDYEQFEFCCWKDLFNWLSGFKLYKCPSHKEEGEGRNAVSPSKKLYLVEGGVDLIQIEALISEGFEIKMTEITPEELEHIIDVLNFALIEKYDTEEEDEALLKKLEGLNV